MRAEHEGVSLLGVRPARPDQQRNADQQEGVDQDADDEALAYRIKFGQRRRQVGLQGRQLAAIGALAQGRQQERVEPDDEAAGQARHDAVAVGALPVEAEHDAGGEVGDGAETDQADRGERQVSRDDALVGVARHQDHDHGGAAHEHHERAHVARHARPPPRLPAQQVGHQQLVADHPRQRHAGHDHHRGRGRQAADEDEGRQPGLAVGERQLQHEEVGIDLRPQQQKAGGGDRHHEQVDQHQVGREQPARRPEARRMAVLDHGDMELARQAEEGHRRQERGDDPGERRALARHALGDLGRARDMGQEIARPVEQHEQHERPHGQQCQQLDHRFEGDRQHHAAMLLGGLDVAHAEQDGEERHQGGHDQRGVGVHHAARAVEPGRRLGDGLEGRGHRLELQRDVGQHADRGEQRGGDADGAALAVARGQEVGDRRHIVLLGQPHHLAQHREAQDDQQRRAGINKDKIDAGGRGAADRAIKGPRRAVDCQRQAVDGGGHRAGRPGAGVPVTEIGDGEQQAEIGQRQGQDGGFRQHACAFLHGH